MTTENPLQRTSKLRYRAVEFNLIKPEQFLPSLRWAIEVANSNIEKIKSSGVEANFENVILELETASDDVEFVSGIFYNLLSAEATDEVQALAKEFGPILSSFSSDILLDSDLFTRVKEVYDKRNSLALNAEQLKLLEDTYDDFVRNGSLLDDGKKAQLKDIDKKLSVLSPAFTENILKATNDYQLVIKDEKDLEGLPEDTIHHARSDAQNKGLSDSWIFTLQAPSYVPFITYCKNRQLRKEIWYAFNSKCLGGDFDNQENVLKISSLKYQRAQLLGFKNHADFVLKKRMAQDSETVLGFLNKLLEVSKVAAVKEFEELKKYALTLDNVSDFNRWDIGYYMEQLKHKKYDFREEDLRPYFKLENVINGVFQHAKLLYNLEFKPTDEFPTYNPDVKVFEVFDTSGEFIGLFYADFFPRATKKDGAWMTNFYEQGLFKDKIMRAHVGIVCNFSKSTPEKPSLLTFREVQTLFHEFGHALHSLLSHCTYKSLGGTNVYWDFVELPSQLFENWTLEKEGLDLFAHHYNTQEAIPAELVTKIKKSAQFMAGFQSLRQLSFCFLDFSWFNNDPTQVNDVFEHEAGVLDKINFLPTLEKTNMSCSFSHIFSGGYSAGYYSYKWAEVLDADAFELFKEKGIFNKDVATSFRENILSRGGVEHPMELYKKFRGREPKVEALLRREGLL